MVSCQSGGIKLNTWWDQGSQQNVYLTWVWSCMWYRSQQNVYLTCVWSWRMYINGWDQGSQQNAYTWLGYEVACDTD